MVLGRGTPRTAERGGQCLPRRHFGLLIRALDSRKMSIKPNQTKPNQTRYVSRYKPNQTGLKFAATFVADFQARVKPPSNLGPDNCVKGEGADPDSNPCPPTHQRRALTTRLFTLQRREKVWNHTPRTCTEVFIGFVLRSHDTPPDSLLDGS